MKPKCGYELTLVNKTPDVLGSGVLTITTKPENGATITMNGRVLGQKTPYTNDMIATGRYEINVSLDRYKSVTKTVVINDEDNLTLDIEMPIDVAVITLNADNFTDVYVDGKIMKRGTWSGELYSGQHEIIYKKQYYRDSEQTIIVEGGNPKSYSLQLVPIVGSVNITSEPLGAVVFIDNKEYGVTPLEISDLIIGSHELRLQKEKNIWRTYKTQFVLEEKNNLVMNCTMEHCPDGTINGLFSISPTQQVYFSQGNLQYQASTKTWRFAENQWDYIGSANKNISSDYEGWIDLFGWGTRYNPVKTTIKDKEYRTFDDWGNDTISNGDVKNWRTLSKDEWVYLFDERETVSGIRFVMATINGVNGVLLFPDYWIDTDCILTSTNNKKDAFYSSNQISIVDFKNKFEATGAVFLPAAGYRINNNYYGKYGVQSRYWSSTSVNDGGYDAYCIYFEEVIEEKLLGYSQYGYKSLWGFINSCSSASKHYGFSVRLVYPVDK